MQQVPYPFSELTTFAHCPTWLNFRTLCFVRPLLTSTLPTFRAVGVREPAPVAKLAHSAGGPVLANFLLARAQL